MSRKRALGVVHTAVIQTVTVSNVRSGVGETAPAPGAVFPILPPIFLADLINPYGEMKSTSTMSARNLLTSKTYHVH